MIDISKGNNFHEYFKQFGELWLGSSSFSMKQPAPVTQPIMSRFQCSIFFFFFENVKEGQLKMVNAHY